MDDHRRARRQRKTTIDGREFTGLEALLYEQSYLFDFFQAVRVLHRSYPNRRAVGRAGPPHLEAVRFQSRVSLSFPPSAIHEIQFGRPDRPVPTLTQAFMGLFGPNGTMPRHYTELLYRLERERGSDRRALREWLDLFNHRFVSLFYRAWEKYRFYIAYEHGEHARAEPDSFTMALFSLVGHGFPRLRNRLQVALPPRVPGERGRPLAQVEDLALVYYGGLFSHRPRSATGLQAILCDYFQVPVVLNQFQGQWLVLDRANQTRVGEMGTHSRLGVTAVVGERVWEIQTKFRICLGPLHYPQFLEFLPDKSPTASRKAFFLLIHLVRLYVGRELDFDVQLTLAAEEIPECQLSESAENPAWLGWNTWLRSEPASADAADAVFEAEEVFQLEPAPMGQERIVNPPSYPSRQTHPIE